MPCSWKLTYDRFSLQSWLHDIHNDPFETPDFSNKQPIIVDALQYRLELWLFEHSWIINNLHELT